MQRSTGLTNGSEAGTNAVMDNSESNKQGHATASVPEELQRLKDLVRNHRVCWEALPEQLVVKGGQLLQVGFNLNLRGAHDHDTDRPPPGCEQCRQIFGHLREIAEWIVPTAEGPSRYEIEVYDNAVRYDPLRGNRPDVTLTIKILHRSQFEAPVDQCEVFCLHEMEEKLIQIGARHDQWKD